MNAPPFIIVFFRVDRDFGNSISSNSSIVLASRPHVCVCISVYVCVYVHCVETILQNYRYVNVIGAVRAERGARRYTERYAPAWHNGVDRTPA